MNEKKYRLVWVEYEDDKAVLKEDFITACYVSFDSYGPAFLIDGGGTWCPSWHELPQVEIRIWS